MYDSVIKKPIDWYLRYTKICLQILKLTHESWMQLSCVQLVLSGQIIFSSAPKVGKQEGSRNNKLGVCHLADIDTPSTHSFKIETWCLSIHQQSKPGKNSKLPQY